MISELSLPRPAGAQALTHAVFPDASSCDAFVSDTGLPQDWRHIASNLDYAFQPIVNIHSGACFAYECLLRHVDKVGFSSIEDFFDACHAAQTLPAMEAHLRSAALEKFSRFAYCARTRLFLNVDNRAVHHLQHCPEILDQILSRFDLKETKIVLEISERHPLHENGEVLNTLRQLKAKAFSLAIDDFGTGFSGLKLLYAAEPDFIKVDRFFINSIDTDGRKRLLLEHIVSIARVLGITVIAEGIETEREFFICKDIGIDLVQGYLIQRPTTQLSELRFHYPEVEALSQRERRHKANDLKFIMEQVDPVPPVSADANILDIIYRFREERDRRFFPVVDFLDNPIGIVHELDIKNYIYSRYGKDLLSNPSFSKKVRQITRRCSFAELSTKAERILEVFSADADSEGIIIVDNMRYVGILNAASLLRIINEKNIALARDQNPLTKLPGNTLISEYIAGSLSDIATPYAFAYFDFNNFKPFNDTFGFRQGDRAILMFAEILRSDAAAAEDIFLGHIGGDDFFAGFRKTPNDKTQEHVQRVIARFANDAASLYDSESRKAGGVTHIDRDGNPRWYPLLSVSAAIIFAPDGRRRCTPEEVSSLIAILKKESKQPGVGCIAASLTKDIGIDACCPSRLETCCP